MFYPLEFEFSNFQACGIDEAGRGSLAGPLSIALVSFSPAVLKKIIEGEAVLGLADSKQLNEQKRERLYTEILTLASTVRHVFLHSEIIDEKGMNWCIQKGIEHLVRDSRLQNPFLLIDGNYNFFPKNFYPYKSIIKGDEKIISISAASIIAKVKRDRFMKKINCFYPNFQFAIHKGYGTKLHRELILKYGTSKLHRKTFLTKLYESQSQLQLEF